MRQLARFPWAAILGLTLIAALALLPGVALAQDAPPADPAAAPAVEPAGPTIEQRLANLEAYVTNGVPDAEGGALGATAGAGHNAWMMTCAALVLFMTLPGLALFYGGLVRRKNVLSVLAQCFGCAGVVTVLWWAIGYSLVFDSGSSILGGTSFAFFEGVTAAPNGAYSAWVSQNVFAMFQMMFAIITPALIVGAIAERMKFSAVMAFVVLWMFAIYFPLAHMVWGGDGLMNGVWNANASIKSIDFAGGTVVHINAGIAGLVAALIVGRRVGYGREIMAPHSLTMTMIGGALLWVGWFGFNAGSALEAAGTAALAMVNTFVATAGAALAWMVAEQVEKGKPSLLGLISGAVAGLVAVTPAAGLAGPMGSIVLGLVAGLVCYIFCSVIKNRVGYDDSLDVFGVHGVCGIVGALLTGVFNSQSLGGPGLVTDWVTASVGSNGVGAQVWIQLKAVLLTIVWSGVVSVIAYKIVDLTVGLRVPEDEEREGLDITSHGETAYNK